MNTNNNLNIWDLNNTQKSNLDLNEAKNQVNNILQMTSRNLDYEKVSQNLVFQLKQYLKQSRQNWFVVWVSWWIDSALVSTLCALTWEKTVLVELPIHQNLDEVSRAQEHITNLKSKHENIISKTIDLTQIFESFKISLWEITNPDGRYLAEVNTRSRLRANALYAIWNENNLLVAWTWNKVEDYWIWFFTKFWDWAVDISPIWNLYKSEVREMAKYLWICESIIKAKPTDWLHTNWATDEDQIWATYDELEWAMVNYDNWKRSLDFLWREKEVMEIYTKRHEINSHKMEMPPIFEIKL